MNKKTIAHAFKASLPIMVSYIALGLGVGIMMQAKGYNWMWSVFIAVVVYSGSMQFMAPVLLSTGAGFISTALLTLMVNFRLLFYGISQLNRYKSKGWRRFILIFCLSDETFSINCTDDFPPGVEAEDYYLLTSLFDYGAWIIGSIVGHVVGDLMPFSTEGIDFALTALFLVIVINHWESTTNHIPALLGFAFSIVYMLILGPSNFLLPAMISAVGVLLYENKRRGGRPEYV